VSLVPQRKNDPNANKTQGKTRHFLKIGSPGCVQRTSTAGLPAPYGELRRRRPQQKKTPGCFLKKNSNDAAHESQQAGPRDAQTAKTTKIRRVIQRSRFPLDSIGNVIQRSRFRWLLALRNLGGAPKKTRKNVRHEGIWVTLVLLETVPERGNEKIKNKKKGN